MRSTRSLERVCPSTSTVRSSAGSASRATLFTSSTIAPAASTGSMRRVAMLASPRSCRPDRGPTGFDQEGRDEEDECIPRGVDAPATGQEPVNRLESDSTRSDDEDHALRKSRQVLGPAMPIRVLFVGGLARGPDGDERERARGEVEQGVNGLAEAPKASGQEADDELGHDERGADGDRAERDELGAPRIDA